MTTTTSRPAVRSPAIVRMEFRDFKLSMQYQMSQYRSGRLVSEIWVEGRAIARFRCFHPKERIPASRPVRSAARLSAQRDIDFIIGNLPIVIIHKQEKIGVLEHV